MWTFVNICKHTPTHPCSNKDNALQNPVYDSEHVQRYQGNPSSRTQTGYSSQGPAYEQVRVDTATNYDVIDRSGPWPPTTHPDQDYSTLDTDEQEHDYHVLESTNAGGPTAVGVKTLKTTRYHSERYSSYVRDSVYLQ